MPLPPATGKFCVVGAIPNAQLAPAWVTVTVCVAMIITPLRGVAAGFWSTVKVTSVPGFPEGPEVMCSQFVWMGTVAEYVPHALPWVWVT